jgi:hypothetical protein
MGYGHYWDDDLSEEGKKLVSLIQELDWLKILNYRVSFNMVGNHFDIHVETERHVDYTPRRPVNCPGIIESWATYMGD